MVITFDCDPSILAITGSDGEWSGKLCVSDLVYYEIGMESSLIFSRTIFSAIGICSLIGNTANMVLDKNFTSEIVVYSIDGNASLFASINQNLFSEIGEYSIDGNEANLDVFFGVPYQPEECDGLLSDVMTYKSVLNDNVENNMEMAIADQDFDYVCG